MPPNLALFDAPPDALACTPDARAWNHFVAEDDVVNFDKIFLAHRLHLLKTARRYFRNREDAEDVVQDAFLRWRGIDKTGIHDHLAWLTTTVAHLAIDRLRHAHRELLISKQAGFEPIEDPDSIADGDGRPREWHVALFAAHALMDQLSVAERVAFTLHDVFDYAYADVAEVVGKKEPACRQLARRARMRISACRPNFESRRYGLVPRLLAAALVSADISLVVTLLTQGLGSIS